MSVNGNAERHVPQRIDNAAGLVFGVFGGIALMALMLVTVVDVLGRNVLDMTIMGAYELSELAIGLVVAAGIPLVALRSDHVYIDLITNLFKGWGSRLRVCVVLLATIAGEAVVAWRVWEQADLAAQTRRFTSTLQIPVWPVLYIAAVLFAVAALVTAIHFVKASRKLVAEPSGGEQP